MIEHRCTDRNDKILTHLRGNDETVLSDFELRSHFNKPGKRIYAQNGNTVWSLCGSVSLNRVSN